MRSAAGALPEPEPEPELSFRAYVASRTPFTSVLNNPRPRRPHPFQEGGYGLTGWVPSDFDVPPSAAPAVSDRALRDYLQETRQAYADYRASARHAAAEQAQIAAAAQQAEGPGDGAGWGDDGLAQALEADAELRQVPEFFFSPGAVVDPKKECQWLNPFIKDKKGAKKKPKPVQF